MNTPKSLSRAHGIDFASGDGRRIRVSLRSVLGAAGRMADVISEGCRLVRAYNELTRMQHRTLREIGSRRGEIDRILAGYPPRRRRRER